jgi:hypothetical protein
MILDADHPRGPRTQRREGHHSAVGAVASSRTRAASFGCTSKSRSPTATSC